MKNKDLNLAKLRYKYEMIDGKPKLTPILEPTHATSTKAMRKYHKRVATIELNGFTFDADETSITFMSSILTLANFKVNQAIANGTSHTDAYTAVFSGSIEWKDTNKEWRTLTIAEIGNGLEKAMYQIASLIE